MRLPRTPSNGRDTTRDCERTAKADSAGLSRGERRIDLSTPGSLQAMRARPKRTRPPATEAPVVSCHCRRVCQNADFVLRGLVLHWQQSLAISSSSAER